MFEASCVKVKKGKSVEGGGRFVSLSLACAPCQSRGGTDDLLSILFYSQQTRHYVNK